MQVTLYHNPGCSKSRKTLELLESHGAEIEQIDYLRDPPDKETLEFILQALSMEPRQLMRTHESEYAALNLHDTNLSKDELIQAMVDNPILIERPIVIANGKVRLGRPPESVLEILD